MYGRQYDGKELNFEASGGLIKASLVMQDKQTNTYWSIMTGDAIEGQLKGTRLQEWPSEKMRWKEWVAKHPHTLVLSVNGIEEATRDGYAQYWESKGGFRGLTARDRRLKTKEPVFCFQYSDKAYAVPYRNIENGRVFDLGNVQIFLYRTPGAELLQSTAAYVSQDGFEKR